MLHFHVNESMLATRLVSTPSISNTKFEHSQAFCFAPRIGLSPDGLTSVTLGQADSRRGRAGSFDEPSSAGTVTDVMNAVLAARRLFSL